MAAGNAIGVGDRAGAAPFASSRSGGSADGVRVAPHASQNRSLGDTSAPHCGHSTAAAGAAGTGGRGAGHVRVHLRTPLALSTIAYRSASFGAAPARVR